MHRSLRPTKNTHRRDRLLCRIECAGGSARLHAAAGTDLGPVRRFGYSHNTPVQNTPGSDLGVSAFSSSYNEGSAGFILRKHLGREYDFFAAYHFSELGLDGIPGVEQRQVGTVGVEWHPRPTRIE